METIVEQLERLDRTMQSNAKVILNLMDKINQNLQTLSNNK